MSLQIDRNELESVNDWAVPNGKWSISMRNKILLCITFYRAIYNSQIIHKKLRLKKLLYHFNHFINFIANYELYVYIGDKKKIVTNKKK